jgi:hypothetical protein
MVISFGLECLAIGSRRSHAKLREMILSAGALNATCATQ